MLPAFFYTITGKTSYVAAVWGLRVVSLIFFAAGGVLLLSCLSDIRRNLNPARIFLAILYIFEAKAVAFSMNGMETALMLFFLAWLIYLYNNGLPKHWIQGGVGFAGLMWTRPDGCIYIAVLSLASILFFQPPRKKMIVSLLKMACLCAVLYFPWILWTWEYYGTPIAHTILAKSVLLRSINFFDFERLEYTYKAMFGPIYYFMGGWPKWIKDYSFILGIFSSLYWIFPIKDRLGRMVSFLFLCLVGYLFFSPQSPWYFPPVTMLSLVVLTRAGFYFLNSLGKKAVFLKLLIVAVMACIIFVTCYVFVMTAIQMKIQQSIIEDGNRQQIGMWLKKNVRVGESVYAEPLGYIGYFSEAKMLDFPGLVSPEVLSLLQEKKQIDFYSIVPFIHPNWIVLRPNEAEKMSEIDYFRKNYTLAKTFDVTDRLKQYGFIPGKGYLMYDAIFLVYKRMHSIPLNNRSVMINLIFKTLLKKGG